MSDIGWIELLGIIAVIAIVIVAPKVPRMTDSLFRRMRGPKENVDDAADSPSASRKKDE